MREKLASISQKWQGLTGQLDQRDSLIDQAVVKTGQFQELLRSLSNTTTQLENQLTNHHSSSTQPDAVKKQLEDVHNISAQLREERKKLKQAEAINVELSALVTEDYLKADLVRQLESVNKPFKQLEDKAGWCFNFIAECFFFFFVETHQKNCLMTRIDNFYINWLLPLRG